jgi:hypothetical protein
MGRLLWLTTGIVIRKVLYTLFLFDDKERNFNSVLLFSAHVVSQLYSRLTVECGKLLPTFLS